MLSGSRSQCCSQFFTPRASTQETVLRKNCFIRKKARVDPNSQLRVGGHHHNQRKGVGGAGVRMGIGMRENRRARVETTENKL